MDLLGSWLAGHWELVMVVVRCGVGGLWNTGVRAGQASANRECSRRKRGVTPWSQKSIPKKRSETCWATVCIRSQVCVYFCLRKSVSICMFLSYLHEELSCIFLLCNFLPLRVTLSLFWQPIKLFLKSLHTKFSKAHWFQMCSCRTQCANSIQQK